MLINTQPQTKKKNRPSRIITMENLSSLAHQFLFLSLSLCGMQTVLFTTELLKSSVSQSLAVRLISGRTNSLNRLYAWSRSSFTITTSKLPLPEIRNKKEQHSQRLPLLMSSNTLLKKHLPSSPYSISFLAVSSLFFRASSVSVPLSLRRVSSTDMDGGRMNTYWQSKVRLSFICSSSRFFF